MKKILVKVMVFAMVVQMLLFNCAITGFAATCTCKSASNDVAISGENAFIPAESDIALHFDEAVSDASISSESVKLEKLTEDGVYNAANQRGWAIGSTYFKLMDGVNPAAVAGKTLVVKMRLRMNGVAGTTLFNIVSADSFENLPIDTTHDVYAELGLMGSVTEELDRVAPYITLTQYAHSKGLDYPRGEWIDVTWELDPTTEEQRITYKSETMEKTSSAEMIADRKDLGSAVALALYSYSGADSETGATMDIDFSYIKAYTTDNPTKLLINENFEGISSVEELQNYGTNTTFGNDFNITFKNVTVTEEITYEGTLSENNQVYTIVPEGGFEADAKYRLTVSGVKTDANDADVTELVTEFTAKNVYEIDGKASVTGMTGKRGTELSTKTHISASDLPFTLNFSEDTDMSTVNADTVTVNTVKTDGVYNVATRGGNAVATSYFKLMDGINPAAVSGKTLVVKTRLRIGGTQDGTVLLKVLSANSFDDLSLNEPHAVYAKLGIDSIYTGATVDRVAPYGSIYSPTHSAGIDYPKGEWIDVTWELDPVNAVQNMTYKTETMDKTASASLFEERVELGSAVALGLYSYSGGDMNIDFSYIKAYTKDAPDKLLVNQEFDNISEITELANYGTNGTNSDLAVSLNTIKMTENLSYEAVKVGNAYTVVVPNLKYLGDYCVSVTDGVKDSTGAALVNPMEQTFKMVYSDSLYVTDTGIMQSGSITSNPVVAGTVQYFATVKNYTGQTQTAQLFAGLYAESGQLRKAEKKDISLGAGGTQTFTFEIDTAAEAGDTVRVFVWEENLVPVCPADYTAE